MIEKIARIVSIINKIKKEGSVSLEAFMRLQEQMAITVAKYVQDVDLLERIEHDWREIRIPMTMSLRT